MEVSYNRGTPKSSISRWDFPWNKPSSEWGTPIPGNLHIQVLRKKMWLSGAVGTDVETPPFRLQCFGVPVRVRCTTSWELMGEPRFQKPPKAGLVDDCREFSLCASKSILLYTTFITRIYIYIIHCLNYFLIMGEVFTGIGQCTNR